MESRQSTFFFQAEDGIRDKLVTGVQTCALPISHHPIGGSLYYEDQRSEAKRRAADFTSERMPKFFDYFEGILRRNSKGSEFLLGRRFSYVDLSLFQMIEGLRYAFPRTMKKLEKKFRRTVALRDRVATRGGVARYLDSPRRLPFNQEGIFRYYPELE